jgi:AraC-like DNA-binding protein
MADILINIYALILWMTLFQALLFAILLIVRAIRESIYSDFILGGLVALLGLSTLPHLLGWLSIGILWNDYTFLPWNGLELAILPTAYLFLLSRLNSNWRLKGRDLTHYWLYFIYFFYHLIVGLQGKTYAKWWWFEVNNRYNVDAVFSVLNVLLFIFYIKQFLTTYKKYQVWSANRYSDLPPLSISWIRNFLIGYLAYAAIDISLTIMELYMGAQYDKMAWAYCATLILTYYISIYGLYNKPVAQVEFPIEPQLSEEKTEKMAVETEKMPYSAAEIADWRTRIEDYLTTQKTYLNPDLRLAELSQHFKINISTLSTLINICFDKNFNDFVNTYRIDLFKSKIDAGLLTQFTLLSLAYESGFNSKTTFNRAFKKHTGVSPSEFIAQKPVKSGE